MGLYLHLLPLLLLSLLLLLLLLLLKLEGCILNEGRLKQSQPLRVHTGRDRIAVAIRI